MDPYSFAGYGYEDRYEGDLSVAWEGLNKRSAYGIVLDNSANVLPFTTSSTGSGGVAGRVNFSTFYFYRAIDERCTGYLYPDTDGLTVELKSGRTTRWRKVILSGKIPNPIPPEPLPY